MSKLTVALVVLTALAGCIVVPYGHYHHHDREYRDDHRRDADRDRGRDGRRDRDHDDRW